MKLESVMVGKLGILLCLQFDYGKRVLLVLQLVEVK